MERRRMRFVTPPIVLEEPMKRFRITFRDRGVDSVPDPASRRKEDTVLAKVITEHGFDVFATSLSKAKESLEAISPRFSEMNKKNPKLIICQEFELTDLERASVSNPAGEDVPHLSDGAVLAFEPKIVWTESLAASLPPEATLYSA